MALIQNGAVGTTSAPLRGAYRALLSCASFAAACSLGHAAAHDGTPQVFRATIGESIAAITNAFSSHAYHDMSLIPVPNKYDAAKRRWTEAQATNEWSLYADSLPVAFVRARGRSLPYFAEFDITAEPITTNTCKITVRTVAASVRDGKEIGIHGGWAWHEREVAPILQEETNVLLRIEKQLKLIQSGDSKPLPATADRNEAFNDPNTELLKFRGIEYYPGDENLSGALLLMLDRDYVAETNSQSLAAIYRLEPKNGGVHNLTDAPQGLLFAAIDGTEERVSQRYRHIGIPPFDRLRSEAG